MATDTIPDLSVFANGLPLDPLPPRNLRRDNRPHAPNHTHGLSDLDEKLALKNALRYFPRHLHKILAAEFAMELLQYGHIYMYRFMPKIPLRAYPIDSYPSRCQEGAAMMLMICNNLDPKVAQFPDELVTYGGNGQVFSNWAQFWLVMYYLSRVTLENTLVLYSGHPHGLFPSSAMAPRAVVTNGMVLPARTTHHQQYERLFALGVTQYGQMTAGSFCYIGPQGIVHGTTITLANAMRKHLAPPSKSGEDNPFGGRVFLSSGLGGMSGAQPKAAVISGCIGVIAEVCEEALRKRHQQGWVLEVVEDMASLLALIAQRRKEKAVTSIGYLGNIVDVWEALVEHHRSTGEMLIDLGSDQTSCHNPFLGGYYPVGISYQDARLLMHADPAKFKASVEASLRRQVVAINYLCDNGLFFFDYGNAFLLQASRAKADILSSDRKSGKEFRYPSYVEDVMGDIFSMGFGPFRWVCTSGLSEDLDTTDSLARQVLLDQISNPELPEHVRNQYRDNERWIFEASKHKLVVGSQARILYSDQVGRIALARVFNRAIEDGRIKGPIVLSRDHHDVSGTDSPYRETSSVYDGSAECTDMAVHNVIGDSFRGASWVSLHNGGGVGWGEVVNGGFGLLLDGSERADQRATQMLSWDVSNGVTRRAWAGNRYADEAIRRTVTSTGQTMEVTMSSSVEDESILIDALKASKIN